MKSRCGILIVTCLALTWAAAPVSSGSLGVSAAAATIGAFGLEVTVGDECSSADSLTLSPPPSQIQGEFEACLDITADNVEVSGSGATFRAGSTIALGDGFSVAPGVEFVAELDPALANDFASVDDASPIDEAVYHATFYLRLDDLGGTDKWVMINALDVILLPGGGAQSAGVNPPLPQEEPAVESMPMEREPGRRQLPQREHRVDRFGSRPNTSFVDGFFAALSKEDQEQADEPVV